MGTGHSFARRGWATTVALSLWLSGVLPATAQFALLHSFTGGSPDGSRPDFDSLTLLGSTLYGLTTRGGDSDGGALFRLNTDGSAFDMLHEFAGGSADGLHPYGPLTVSGSTLYGTTSGGGEGNGTVFKIDADGTDFALLHSFATTFFPPWSARNPYGGVVLAGSTLYGMALWGGDMDYGAVFKVDTNGTGYSTLHEFTNMGGSDGSRPYGSLTLDGSTLHAMTYGGGEFSFGTVFKMNTNGAGFSVLHSFSSWFDGDGGNPYGSLTLDGSTLYGMTYDGGARSLGTVFRINVDGSGYAVLHDFAGGADSGSRPYGSLIVDGSTLYGMTSEGGDFNRGTVFQINSDGSDFTLLHEFAGGSSDGARPHGSLILEGTTLYGMTYEGGGGNQGTVFSLSIPEPGTSVLALAGLVGVRMLRRRRRLPIQRG